MATAPDSTSSRWAAITVNGIVLALLLTIAAACGSAGGESSDGAVDVDATATSTAAATSAESQTADQPEQARTSQPEALVATAGGGQLDWNSLQGLDVVLWFWAPW